MQLRRVCRFFAPHRPRVLCCRGPARVAVFRAPGRHSHIARVGASRFFVLRGARGSPQIGVCRQRFVLRTQATSFAALPGIQSSAIVLAGGAASCCRLTSRSRRTAAPPLNSSVSFHDIDLDHRGFFWGATWFRGSSHRKADGQAPPKHGLGFRSTTRMFSCGPAHPSATAIHS